MTAGHVCSHHVWPEPEGDARRADRCAWEARTARGLRSRRPNRTFSTLEELNALFGSLRLCRAMRRSGRDLADAYTPAGLERQGQVARAEAVREVLVDGERPA